MINVLAFSTRRARDRADAVAETTGLATCTVGRTDTGAEPPNRTRQTLETGGQILESALGALCAIGATHTLGDRAHTTVSTGACTCRRLNLADLAQRALAGIGERVRSGGARLATTHAFVGSKSAQFAQHTGRPALASWSVRTARTVQAHG